MKKLLQLSVRVSLISLLTYSGSAFAMGQRQKQAPMDAPPPDPAAVRLSSPAYTFGVNFTALIMKPMANNLDYGAEANPFSYGDAQPIISPNWIVQEISPDYHFGFDLGIGGVFHETKSSLTVNWERYHSPSDSSSKTLTNLNDMMGPFFEVGPDDSVYKKAKGSVNFRFDEVNLEYGTFVSFGRHLHMNLFSGVSFARIVQNRFTTFSDLPGTTVRTIKVPSKFTGGGPQLGLDFCYQIVRGFQFVGNTRATLYIGTLKNSTTYSTTSLDLVALGDQNPNIQTTTVKNKTGIVPGFEGKLGLAYDFEFRRHYRIKLEAGYRAQIYLNSIRSIDMGSQVALAAAGSVGSQTTGVYARTFERTVSDFGLAGPYVSLYLGF